VVRALRTGAGSRSETSSHRGESVLEQVSAAAVALTRKMKYRLIERIGSGGMAEVFRATGVGPDGFERAFIIKRIHPRLSQAPEFVSMFVHEAKILARLIHPNIVQVFELAYHDGAHYMVMEPVEGMDMSWLLRRRRERPHES